MAVGILGVGLTMVASVFPVAVDQSRRSREATMAALSARSVAAIIRARRDRILPWLRQNAGNKTVELTRFTDSPLPPDLRSYNPDLFLYYLNRSYSYWGTPFHHWSAGGYTPVVFATPIGNIGSPGNPPSVTGSTGPWRLTIAVFKATGVQPFYLDSSPTGTGSKSLYLRSWIYKDPNMNNMYRWKGSAGSYVLDWAASTNPDSSPSTNMNFRGEGYMVEAVVPDRTSPTDATRDTIKLATGCTASAANSAPTASSTIFPWVSLPGALTVYHTIVGD